MKNNKAFTLVELLAVVTILTILSLIITPIIDKNIKKSKEKMYKAQVENIRMAAEIYYSDNISLRPEEGASSTITLSELMDTGYISDNIKNPKTGEPFTEYIYVKIKNTNQKFEYLVCPIEACS